MNLAYSTCNGSVFLFDSELHKLRPCYTGSRYSGNLLYRRPEVSVCTNTGYQYNHGLDKTYGKLIFDLDTILLRSVKDLNCSEERLAKQWHISPVYIQLVNLKLPFLYPCLHCLLLLTTFLSRICDGVLHNYPTPSPTPSIVPPLVGPSPRSTPVF